MNMNYYNEIKNKLIDNEIYSKVKDYSKERNMVITHYDVGKLLFDKEYVKIKKDTFDSMNNVIDVATNVMELQLKLEKGI